MVKQAINMPKQGDNILKFNNFRKQLPVPFAIYVDFEAIKVASKIKKWRRRRKRDHTLKPHKDCGYGYKVVCCYKKKYNKPIQTY